MRDFDDSTLWRISSFDRVRRETGTSGFARLGPETLLPTTLLADLRQLERDWINCDALEIIAEYAGIERERQVRHARNRSAYVGSGIRQRSWRPNQR